jgi:NAD(P)H-hydrate repair Nnr-like enzyme with NAD(P)H-hydrate dehydratase domain
MAKLLGLEKAAIRTDRIKSLREAVRNFGCSVVLKGAHSLVGSTAGTIHINTSGIGDNKSALATAGTGDILNGTIAAVFCLGLEFEAAIRTGVFIHGLAGDMAADAKGPDGTTAGDVLDCLPDAVQYYRTHLPEIREAWYQTINLI